MGGENLSIQQGCRFVSKDLNIGETPGFGGLDAGPNLQPSLSQGLDISCDCQEISEASTINRYEADYQLVQAK